jgi:hypothetical protein
MRPSSKQLIAGIRWSFETYAVPDLTSRLGQSAGRSILNLLDHLHVRVDVEGQLLMDDNQDMRSLFEELSVLLEPALENGAGPEVRGAAAEMKERVGKQYRPAGAYPTVDSLTEENEDLKRTLVKAIRALQEHKDGLPPDIYGEADQVTRAQLRRQLDREHRWIQPIMGRRPY